MEADEAVLAALNDLRAMFPAMRVRTEHVVLDRESTVFRATVTLPTGAEATGYGSVTGGGPGAVSAAEHLALARAMAFLGIDPDTLEVPDDLGERSVVPPVAMGAAAPTAERRIAEEPPTDPFNLGTSPSAAAVAAATGMRLGVRAGQDGAPGDRPVRPRPVERVERVESVPESVPEPAGDNLDEPDEPASAPAPVATAAPARPAPSSRPAPEAANDSDDDAAVSHQAFWRWAAARGLENRTDVEELLGRSIGGLRPAAVRDLIVAAQEGIEPDEEP